MSDKDWTRDRDFIRIIECIKMFQNIGVIPSNRLVSRALGWNIGTREYWSHRHDEMLEEAILMLHPGAYHGPNRLFNNVLKPGHQGTEVQAYPGMIEPIKNRLPVTKLAAERTMIYDAMGGEIQ